MNMDPQPWRQVPVPTKYAKPCGTGKGLGMVALRRILPGEIILEERPLIILPDEIYEGRTDTAVLSLGYCMYIYSTLHICIFRFRYQNTLKKITLQRFFKQM